MTTTQQRAISSVAAVVIAVGFLFLLPTETGLSFAAADSSSTSDNSGNNNSGDSGSKGTTSDQPSSTPSDQPTNAPDQPQQQPQNGPTTTPTNPENPEGDGKRKPGEVCNDSQPWCNNWWKWWHKPEPVKVVVHTKTIHDSSGTGHLTVAQQNCMYGALQLGFSSNAQNRADATYAAILGCFS